MTACCATPLPGETLIYKVTGDDTNGTLDVLVLNMQPKSGPPLHIHHHQHETIYFLKGSHKVQLGDEVFRCEAGGFVLSQSEFATLHEHR